MVCQGHLAGQSKAIEGIVIPRLMGGQLVIKILWEFKQIFPRENFVDCMVNEAPPGTLDLAAQSPWMTDGVLDHLITFTGGTKDNPTLVIMDNHQSHLAVNTQSRNRKWSDHTNPASSLHTQTTTAGCWVFGPFMVHYNQAISNFHLKDLGAKIDIHNIGDSVGIAHQKSMSI